MKPLTALLLGAAANLPAFAVAQDRAVLEEIIVTAQKREETLQDVPIAISALSADTLAKQGIANLNDFQGGQVPALKVVQFAGRPNTLQIGIRGITEADPTQLTVERPIAVYVDGVYVARGNGMDTEVFDLERMEVLRGPQGTLFGRNAEGGALNIVTRKPKGDFGFKQELEATTLDEYKSRTLIDTPEWNGLSASLGYLHREANGWINNPGGKRDFNWQDKDAYRLALQYNTADVVVDYAYDHSDVDYMQNYNILLNKPAGSYNPRPAGYGRTDNAWAGTLEPAQNTESEGHNLTVEWIIDDRLTLKSITGYRELQDDNSAAGTGANIFLPGGIAPLGTGALPASAGLSDNQSVALTRQNQLSQEFQLIGDLDRLEWQTGVLFFHEDGSFDASTRFGYLYTGCTPGVYGTTCGLPTLQLPAASGVTRTNVDTDSYGVFAQATWNPDVLEDRLKLTLGLRYGKDSKDIERTLERGSSFNEKASATSERVDPALTIAYQLLDDTSVYARYSTAYRGGGVSVREAYTFTPYDEEEIEATEVGVKSVFWDNRARFNAAVFYNEIDQLQMPVQQTDCGPVPCASSNTQFVNASGKARMSGLELDASVLVVDGFTVSIAYTYLDNSLPAVTDNGVLRQPTLNNAPRNSWALNLDYEFEPFSFGTLQAHLDVTDSDEYCFNTFSCRVDSVMAAGRIAGVQGGDNNRLVNARLTLSEIVVGEGALLAALWAKNLTDEEYINFGYTAPAGTSPLAPAIGNTTVGQYGDPRSVGVTLTYQY
jgi:iron complex outermembrane receptor protein